MGDDAQAVIFERTEPVRSPLYQFHFSVEALRDAVVAGEAPHAGYFLAPVSQRLCEGEGWLKAAVAQLLDKGEEFADLPSAGALG